MANKKFTLGKSVGVPTLAGLNSTTPVACAAEIAMSDGTTLEDNINEVKDIAGNNKTNIDNAAKDVTNIANEKLSDVLVNGESIKEGTKVNLQLCTVNGKNLLGSENIEISNDITSQDSNSAPVDAFNEKGAILTRPDGTQVLPITTSEQVYCYPNVKLSDHLKGMYWILSKVRDGLGVIYTLGTVTYKSLMTDEVVPVLGSGYELEYVLDNVYLSDLAASKCTVMAAKLVDKSMTATGSPFSGKDFTELDLDNLNTEELTTLAYCFCNCKLLSYVYMRRASGALITSMLAAFKNCSSLKEVKLCNDYKSLTTINSMFYKCSSLTAFNFGDCDMSNVIDAQYAFYKCTKLSFLSLGTGLSVSLDVAYCPLNNNSICGIFRGLADLTGKDPQTISISSYTNSTLSDTDRALAVEKNWNIVINTLVFDPNDND